jgi:hypothetical protein
MIRGQGRARMAAPTSPASISISAIQSETNGGISASHRTAAVCSTEVHALLLFWVARADLQSLFNSVQIQPANVRTRKG